MNSSGMRQAPLSAPTVSTASPGPAATIRKLGMISSVGKSYLDVRQSLSDLGIDEEVRQTGLACG